MSDALVSFGPFVKGVNNRLDDHEMPIDGENGMLRQAVNVVLSDAGRLSLRPGHELLQPVTEARYRKGATRCLSPSPTATPTAVVLAAARAWGPIQYVEGGAP